MSDEKKCPTCAELVKAEAIKCRFCGHEFVTNAPSSATAIPVTPKAKMGAGKGCLILAGILVALGILGSIVGPSKSGSSGGSQEASDNPTAQVTAVDVSPVELERAYASNEAAAQSLYGDKLLRVKGTIASIDLGISDEPFLVLKGEGFTGPQAELTKEAQQRATSLSKGQKVTLLCQNVSEIVGTPMLKDCSFE